MTLANGVERITFWSKIKTVATAATAALAAAVAIVGIYQVCAAAPAAPSQPAPAGVPVAARTADAPRGAAAIAPAPAAVNPCNGMQEREEVFEFTEKPKVTKNGEKWVITFASKGKCDATVSIVDKDGKVIRHLASGVLGKNAPHPFQ